VPNPEYICHRHDKVIKILDRTRDDIRSVLRYKNSDTDIEELYDFIDNIDSILYDAISEVEEAKNSGERMEARLSRYREAIEDLGFTRNS
jgi:predicted Zn-ribbon and HTH transcriptional regulator